MIPATTRTKFQSAKTVTFSDLTPADAWAKAAIKYVAATNPWMLDFEPNPDGSYAFQPDVIETRKYFARSVVEAFAPDQLPDPSIVLSDVDATSPWYPYVAVAVANGWLPADANGAFHPDDPVTMAIVHRALVLALGLRPAAVALNHIHTADGSTFKVPANFGTTLLGMRLGLRYNAPTGKESMDVGPLDDLSRAQVAYSLFHAATQPSWNIDDLLTQYADVELPHLGPRRTALVQWGIKWVGYPYVWGGEWGLTKPEPAGLGGQPRSGFDCSGFSWWLLRADDGAWKVAPPRPVQGLEAPAADLGGDGGPGAEAARVQEAAARRSDVLRRRRGRRDRPRGHVHRQRVRAGLQQHAGRRDDHVGRRAAGTATTSSTAGRSSRTSRRRRRSPPRGSHAAPR